jgi:hypothetical protein
LRVDRTAKDVLPARLKRLVYQGGHFHADLVLERADNLPLTITLPEPTDVHPGDLLPIILADGWVVPDWEKTA